MGKCWKLGAAIVVAAGLCFAGWTGASAQSLEFGIKAGLGLAKLMGDDATVQECFELEPIFIGAEIFYLDGCITDDVGDTKTGFVGGAYATARINPQFGIRLEALYLQKGGKGKISGTLDLLDGGFNEVGTVSVTGENKLTLDYVEIPLLAVYSFPLSPTANVDLFAGPAIAFNTKAEFESSATICLDGECEPLLSETDDIKDIVKDTDFGGVIGAGFSFKLSRATLFGEGRWTYGFSEIIDDPSLLPGESNPDLKNSAFAFMLGLQFPLVATP